MSMTLFTIGYEAATLPVVIGRLRAAGVGVVVDVRAVAAPRRAGVSKALLRASLAGAGIAHEHLRGLGTPKPGREAARKGRVREMAAIVAAPMATPEARDALALAVALARERPAALSCVEADAAGCRRRIVAGLFHKATGSEVRNLQGSPSFHAGVPRPGRSGTGGCLRDRTGGRRALSACRRCGRPRLQIGLGDLG